MLNRPSHITGWLVYHLNAHEALTTVRQKRQALQTRYHIRS